MFVTRSSNNFKHMQQSPSGQDSRRWLRLAHFGDITFHVERENNMRLLFDSHEGVG